MKKTWTFAFLMVMAFVSLQSFSTDPKDVDPIGTFTFTAPMAPEGYGSGDIIVGKDQNAYTATLKFGEYSVKGSSVKYEKNVLTFTVYLEGEYIRVKATFSADGVKGTASYSEGEVEFTAKKKAQKK